ncbi:beta-ketoacyl-ACP reductase [Halalkalicoccus subterraneus]|uniref:beta-ketoacyl-ACP reductase n=1 Tax=Halalkalicoccus subterraneus TaxID=2675002 RepID=UPI000EFA8CDD|nr:beta-ketoacyl-ACP reductase [Halalkalicoccus subterraneus]
MELEGRTCLVTGSSRGIGRGIAGELANEGANVAINYRASSAAAEEVVDGINTTGGSAMATQADVTEEAEVAAMHEEITDAFGPVDILVNNAGINVDTLFSEMTRAEWDRVIDVDLTGAFVCTKEFFDDIAAAEEGRLINISSIVGKQGNLGQANYAAAKSGMFGLTRTLALELADSGSTANCVAPGFTETEMIEGIPQQVREKIKSEIPLGRFATIEEIACTVAFVASPKASYITGEVLDVNGGMDL